MKRNEIHSAWAPNGARWSRWVKPVLFAHVDEALSANLEIEPFSWVSDVVELEATDGLGHPHRSSARTRDVALVVDLPSATSIQASIGLLADDFFPVPLFNAFPHVMGVVNQAPLIKALTAGAGARERAVLSKNAPPAFLLDSLRLGETISLRPGRYDNRWMIFETDFPSSKTFLDSEIRRVVVVHQAHIAADVMRVLVEWQRVGITIFSKRVDEPGLPKQIVARGPSLFARLAQWWTRADLRRQSNGSFGAVIRPAGG